MPPPHALYYEQCDTCVVVAFARPGDYLLMVRSATQRHVTLFRVAFVVIVSRLCGGRLSVNDT
jgi:hypothetical protein